MLKFSIRKYLIVSLLFMMVAVRANEESVIASFFAKIENKSNDSTSLEAISKIENNTDLNTLKSKISNSVTSLTVEFTEGNFKINSKDAYSSSFLSQIVSDFRTEFANNSTSITNNSFDINANFSVLVSNDLCDLIGIKSGAVLPSNLFSKGSLQSILLSESYTSLNVREVVLSLISMNLKNQKKYADPVEDLRLRINVVYINSEFVQIDELALSPTSITTGSSIQFRAKGGTNDYIWRLIPSETSDSKISATTGSDITYTGGSNETRTFDVLILTDGIEEVSINIIVVKARLKNDVSGSKGGGCFIRQKFRD